MAEPTRVLGFDPGLYVPAFAILDMKGKYQHVQVFRDKAAIDTSADVAWRAHHIAAVAIRQIIAKEGSQTTYALGIEGPAYGYKDSNSMDQLARCRQALYDACAEHLSDFVYFSVPPTSARTSIGLKGRGPKDDVVAQVQRLFQVNLNQTNKLYRQAEADAISIANATLGLWRRRIVL